MKKVLIVDDDKSFLHSLIDGFKAYEDNFTIATAGDGLEAVEILQKETISLVLTDLKMPRMDGFELLALLTRDFTSIPVIVMTAFGTPEMEDNLRDMGTFQYIEKPIDFAVLVEKIITGLAGPSKGYITGVSLSSFLQLIEIDKKTCTLTIHAGSKNGILYFRDGNLLDASFRNFNGGDAAYTIVSWTNVEIEIDNSCLATEQNIEKPLGFILLEGSRRKDESNTAIDLASSSGQTGSLESLNMEELDLDLSTKTSSFRETPGNLNTTHPAQPEMVNTNPGITQFISLLSSFPEINSAIISTKEGTILHQAGQPDGNTGSFVAYVVSASKQIGAAIGASGVQYSIFTLLNDSRILVLNGKDVIVGLNLDGSTAPEPIANGLRPVLDRITL